MKTQTDLDHALLLADIADEITSQHYLSRGLVVHSKPDKTPVTEADTAVEKALSHTAVTKFGDSYLGEEGTRHSAGPKCWTVDPIDGTRNFLRGMPVWATLISVKEDGRTLAAVVSAPALGRRWWASEGHGAWTRDADGRARQLHVSSVATLENAFLLHASLFTWDKTTVGLPAVMDLLRGAWRHRGMGDFLNHMLVAEGAADACLEADPKAWDLEAPQLIIQEAGGHTWTNAKSTTPPEQPRIAISSNTLLEPTILKALGLHKTSA